MLTAACFMLRHGVADRDLGPTHLDQRHRDTAIRRLLRRLDDLGYQVPIPHRAS
jgi:peptidoglycan hydrolase-like protein with peptidoglycan-binding domain